MALYKMCHTGNKKWEKRIIQGIELPVRKI